MEVRLSLISTGRSQIITLVLLMLFVLVLGLPAASTKAKDNDPGPNTFRFASSKKVSIKGMKKANGQCTKTFPELQLAPEEWMLAAQEVSSDLTTCTTVYEIGVPLNLDEVTGDDLESGTTTTITQDSSTASQQFSRMMNRRQDQVIAQGIVRQGAGYYKMAWRDVVGITVNSVQTNIVWQYDMACVKASASGSGTLFWKDTTGWKLINSGYTQNTTCARSRAVTDAVFENRTFCDIVPITVRTTYDDVYVVGDAIGNLRGGVVATSSVEIGGDWGCPDLSPVWGAVVRTQ